ncbi:NAD(P)H-hydrate dehydratase [Candidatus Daviesbacteria bacterium RIFCSPLOWO2_02_FULL_36_7]|uniref:ADP-dependent (S)-NAD(P)H-hydrate dehydratase n=1 Tax=Candidatus Daviesbacteria bacterium RIFCSPLOWO2_02_FULL_36_7 TaxID=1797792 RepID=A0A1F5MIB7_9BACT|nr:MAG: NAD(P)H-hydrate dehydratase [Candidatus Daviesbacteria bacterium RIFCSPLOWO2_02_FULL_36_7]
MVLTKEWVVKRLPKRPKNAHKGTFGKVLVIAGSEHYPGAAYLSSSACYRIGAGLVVLATESSVKIIVARQLPEVTFLSLGEVIGKIDKYDVLLLGPGLGQKEKAVDLVSRLLTKELPKVVIDGDGLNILSKIGGWWDKLDKEVVLTPHPGEMTRLTGKSVDEIQTDRVNVVQYFAKKWKKIVVLKGANTIIVSPAGQVLISPFANPVLATAGTGDILAGVIAGLLAQGLNAFDAACVGVYIHGLAGDRIRERTGDAGALASELLPILPQVIKDLVNKTEHRIS